jgi:hypothetical protein
VKSRAFWRLGVLVGCAHGSPCGNTEHA